MCMALDYLNKIDNIFTEIQTKKEALTSELSKVDLELEDFLHYVEFENFNACQGYKYAKKIQELRQTRRDIKDELAPLSHLHNSITLHTHPKVKKLSQSIDKNNSRVKVYKPRVAKGV